MQPEPPEQGPPPAPPAAPPALWTVRPVSGYEPTQVAVGRVVSWGIALIVGAALVFVVATIMLVIFARPSVSLGIPPPGVAIDASAPTPLPPEPRLEATPGVTSAFVNSREESVLNSYGWVDRSKGVVRIPIAQAINVVAQRGLPTQPGATAPREDVSVPSYSSSGRQTEELLH